MAHRAWLVIIVVVLSGETLNADSLGISTASVPPDTPIEFNLTVDGVTSAIGGYSFGVLLPDPITFVAYAPNLALGAEFFGTQVQVDEVGADDFFGVGVIFSISDVITRGPGFLNFGVLTLDLPTPGLGAGESAVIPIVDGLGSPPITVEYATTSGAVIPDTLNGGILGATAPASQIWVASPTDDTITSVATDGTVGTVIAGAGSVTPRGVAVDPNGILWAAYRDSDLVRRFDSSGAEVFVFGTSDQIDTGLGSSPEAVAIGRAGNAWIANEGNLSLSVVNPFGQLLFGDGGIFGTITLAAPPIALASDRVGSVWVAASDGLTGFLYRVNRSGAIATSVAYGTDDPSAVAVDRQGFAWLCLENADRVDRVASDGSVASTFAVPSPRAVTIRRRPGTGGLREAWVVGGDPAAPSLHRLRSGNPVDDFTTLGSVDLTGVTVDGLGRVWVARADGTIERLDMDVDPPTTPLSGVGTDVGTDAVFLGDATGYRQAFVQFLDGNPAVNSFFDFDQDGFVNIAELDAQSDVFDAGSTPGAIVPVQGLACANTGPAVNLSWSIAVDVDPVEVGDQGYTQIQVLDNGVPTPVQPGPADTVLDLVLDLGEHVISVIGVVGGVMSEPAVCQVTVGNGELLDTDEVVAVDGDLLNPFGISTVFPPPTDPADPVTYVTDPEARLILGLNAEEAVISSLSTDSIGGETAFDGDFGATGCAYVPGENPGDPATLFVVGGATGSPIEIRAIEIDDAGMATVGSIHIFASDGGVMLTGRPGGLAAQRTTDGLDIILLYVGPDGCEIPAMLASSIDGQILSGASFTHPSVSAAPFGLSGVAFASEFTPFDVDGGTAWITEAGAQEGEYQMVEVQVASGEATPTGSAISFTVLEAENALGGFDFVADIDAVSLSVDVVGITTSSVSEVGAPAFFVQYVSGDANMDGGVNIADAITLLNILFAGDAQAQCDAALDPNGDGGTDIGDAIYLLNFLFGGGRPPVGNHPDAGGNPFECILPVLP